MAIAQTAEAYRDALISMLPPGAAWPTDPDSELGKLLLALGDELARIEQRGIDLLNESDPRGTLEMLTDWEGTFDLPDACSGLGVTLQQRREAVTALFTLVGGQSRQYFIDLAESLGFPGATITEFDPHTVDETVDAPIYGLEWLHAWQLTAALGDINQFNADSHVGESLGEETPITRLECVINRLKPAHTVALFEYT